MSEDKSGPDYTNPPVIETILGVQFEPLPKLKNAHLGAFWTLLGEDWPTVADAQPLNTQFEKFGAEKKWQRIGLKMKLTQDPACRIQIKNHVGTRMIQVQNGRLHLNWLGQEGGDYPRYDRIREEFLAVLARFQQFVVDRQIGDFVPNQWEVTYLNHIPRGTVWLESSQWNFFRLLSQVPSISSIARFESFSGEWHYVIHPERGRLHIQWEHGRGSKPYVEELIVLTLTARGPVTPESSCHVEDGLDIGHESIVSSFRALMSDKANEFWGLKNA